MQWNRSTCDESSAKARAAGGQRPGEGQCQSTEYGTSSPSRKNGWSNLDGWYYMGWYMMLILYGLIYDVDIIWVDILSDICWHSSAEHFGVATWVCALKWGNDPTGLLLRAPGLHEVIKQTDPADILGTSGPCGYKPFPTTARIMTGAAPSKINQPN